MYDHNLHRISVKGTEQVIFENMCVHTCVCVCTIIISEKREHDLKKSGDEYLEGMEEEGKRNVVIKF